MNDKHWAITNRRTENIKFSRMLKPAPCNESEDAGTHSYEILTVTLPAFVRRGFVSPEIMPRTLDVIEIGGRYFEVGKSETGSGRDKKTWLSVSLPPELDPTPPFKKWEMIVGNDGKLYRPEECFQAAQCLVVTVKEAKP